MRHTLTPRIIVFLSIVRFLFFGKANKKQKAINTVIVLNGGKLGDMICVTPIFRAIKEKYPNCKVVVVGIASNKKTLEYNPDVDSYIELDERKVFSTIEKIRNERADFGCIVSPGTVGLALLYLSGIPLIAAPRIRVGWSPYETRSYKMISHFVVTKDFMIGEYIPKQFLKTLEPIGIFTESTKKFVYFSKDADSRMNEFLSPFRKRRSLLVGVMPGAGNKLKQWPADRFAEVANHLAQQHNAHILVIGNDSNRAEIDATIAGIKSKGQVTECSTLSLDELKALVSKLDMTVSVDTGPVFIAEAAGVPTIDIGGVIHPQDLAPNDGVFHHFITYDGEPLLWSMNWRVYDYEKVRRGIESITVTRVIGAADELVERIKREKMRTTT